MSAKRSTARRANRSSSPRNVVLSYGNTSGRARDRLSDDELATIGASGMEHGFEHLNSELEGQ